MEPDNDTSDMCAMCGVEEGTWLMNHSGEGDWFAVCESCGDEIDESGIADDWW